jgi:hypothetical protein
MEALPPLVSIARYGNVRKTDAQQVLQIVSSMIARICIGLPNAVTGINEEAAEGFLEFIGQLEDAVSLLQQQDITGQWQKTLQVISDNSNAAPAICGYTTRLLTNAKLLEGESLIKVFHFRMSPSNAPGTSAAWLEGFLRGSGSILLLDEDLWSLVNSWVDTLDAQNFTQVLPLLRRTFSNFSPSERRKLGEKAKHGKATIQMARESSIDETRAPKGLPIVLQMLGITKQTTEA